MSWAVTIVAGAGLATAAINADASRKASNQQADAARAAGDTELYMYEQSRSDLEPFRQLELEGANIGMDAMKSLKGKVDAGPLKFKASEGYNWTLDQRVNALDKSAVAGGRSSNADTMKYAQGLASTEYDNFLRRYRESLNPLQSIARTPSGATSQGIGVNQSYAQGAGNALMNQGNAAATGTINNANSITGGINSALNNYMMWKYMNG